ncbi:hypothetical protein PHET_03232 [Paragonimus heterotremus]|uniref:Uncharacterized protein n=1 Tax=Paragonimus heterotremus TaxID=100268 RepID=A0A8J4TCB0_9TREM|nr:hypothetical protein PHET_03232 [Paragonimus heterotremus]
MNFCFQVEHTQRAVMNRTVVFSLLIDILYHDLVRLFLINPPPPPDRIFLSLCDSGRSVVPRIVSVTGQLGILTGPI